MFRNDGIFSESNSRQDKKNKYKETNHIPYHSIEGTRKVIVEYRQAKLLGYHENEQQSIFPYKIDFFDEKD